MSYSLKGYLSSYNCNQLVEMTYQGYGTFEYGSSAAFAHLTPTSHIVIYISFFLTIYFILYVNIQPIIAIK